MPVVSLLLLILKEALQLLTTGHLLFFYWLAGLTCCIRSVISTEVQITKSIDQKRCSRSEGLVWLRDFTSWGKYIHAICICYERLLWRERRLCLGRSWHRLLLLAWVTKKFVSTCEGVCIPIRLFKRNLLLIRLWNLFLLRRRLRLEWKWWKLLLIGRWRWHLLVRSLAFKYAWLANLWFILREWRNRGRRGSLVTLI